MIAARPLAPALLALAACHTSAEFSGDPFPIYIERAGDAFVVQITTGADDAPRAAVLDLLSPLTMLDADLDDPPRRRGVDLAIHGRRSPTDSRLVTRARFGATALFQHPCAVAGPCSVGSPGAPVAITGVIGADTLRGDAIRFSPTNDRLFVLPDVAGTGDVRDAACDADLLSPFYGGGTLVVGGTEVAFSGLRIALGVCLSPAPDAIDPAARGTDAAMVLSTGIGPSLLGRSRYDAWAAASGAPAFDDLPPSTLLLPSGLVEGKLARIDGMAIVGRATAPRGACREVYAQHLLTQRDCVIGDDCPCTEDAFCSAPSVVELDSTIEAVVVDDRNEILQALRAELRPAQPEIDGILGVSALASVEFDVDYPHDRLLFRCEGPGCVSRPALRSRDSRALIEACVAGALPAIDAGTDGDAGTDPDAIVP